MARFLLVIGAALFIGVFSANYIVQGRAGLISKSDGQWTWWPNAGSTSMDPYTRFYFVDQGRLPDSKFETFEAEAAKDKSGRPLSADCMYALNGSMPESRWWSLASIDAEADERRTTADLHNQFK